ncbi:MAG: triosephosphate isomerase [Acidithiobacillales bacterium SM23_46]|jgi:triosephosphate isomerase|nr:MAG: triosephosphate isomerase [Acidithiobacillales bacterium SM23_46]KPL28654.1 MAG: triosephosphate isomerase [Acidithiobacillales bacterium SM1_46]
MSKRRPFVAGNWKMNGSRAESAALLDGVKAGVSNASKAEVAVCPPFILIPLAAEKLAGSAVAWGGQNLNVNKSGAFTGEISGPMLKDYGCSYVIVGHSERRSLYGESDATVAEKYGAAQAHGLIPILCVGETLAEREGNQTEAVVARQLDAVLAKHGVASLKNAIIAYEPVWAIGTGKTATPQQAQDVHRFIRERIAKQDKGVADAVRILYGGSMKGSNAGELIGQPDIDGGLIGGASLVADEFLAICRAAD